MRPIVFKDRTDAGRQLANVLSNHLYPHPVLILGIPRGGVVVAYEVAEALSAPLDVIISRKIRVPYQPELGMGAVVDGDHITILNEELVHIVGATPEYLKKEIAYQGEEIDRRIKIYRDNRPLPEISGKTVIVIDDGIATGYTFRTALEGLRRKNPSRLIGAAPVAAPDSYEMLQPFADELICLNTPISFMAVGNWYTDFEQVSDEEVVAILHRNWERLNLQEAARA